MAEGKVDAYLELADEAFLKREFADLVKYANALLEIDKKQPRAWFYSGAALVWLTSVKDPKKAVGNMITCWSQALQCCPTKEMRENMAQLINSESSRIYSELLTTLLSQGIEKPQNAYDILPVRPDRSRPRILFRKGAVSFTYRVA